MNYILKGRKTEPCSNLLEWARWFETADRIVKREVVFAKENNGKTKREVTISTVFLGIDHNFSKSGRPILFETMIFGGVDYDQKICERCCTYQDALKQHQHVKNFVTGKIDSL